MLGNVQWCTLTVSLILIFSLVTWKYGSAHHASASTNRNCCAMLPSIMSTTQHQCNDMFTPNLKSLVIIFPSLLCPFFCLCSKWTCCGSAKNFGQHWLCSLQLFYQSVSSDFVPILISSVFIELSICILEFLLVHPCRAYWQVWDSNLWCSSTQGGLPSCCRIWRGWVVEPILHQTLKLWNWIDILSVGIVKF
jgi:hypothetical protein